MNEGFYAIKKIALSKWKLNDKYVPWQITEKKLQKNLMLHIVHKTGTIYPCEFNSQMEGGLSQIFFCINKVTTVCSKAPEPNLNNALLHAQISDKHHLA